MAGTDSGFSAAAFREAIEFAMVMGLPQSEDERATFHFKPDTTAYYRNGERLYPDGTDSNEPRTDKNGNPLDSTIRVKQEAPEPVRVPVAVEFNPTNTDERPVGAFRNTRVRITALDEHWPDIKDAIEVELGGDMYVISYHHPPVGLFEVTVYTMECVARSET